jgi:hypothetical protein
MTEPVATDYEDGETIRASHLNEVGVAVNDLIERVDELPLSGEPLLISGTVSSESGLPVSAELGEVLVDEETGNGFQWNGLGWTNFGQFRGSVGPQGDPSAGAGLLSARPDYDDVEPGFTYTATDEEGGTSYVATPSSWQRIARATAVTAGEELASAAPSASTTGIAINVANTPFRIPELTTASFTMPDRPVRVETSALVVTGIGASTPATIMQVRYTTDGWSTSHNAESRTLAASNIGIWIESAASIPAMIPPAAATPISPGATVQVALFFKRTDTTKTLVVARSDDANPWLKVIAG